MTAASKGNTTIASAFATRRIKGGSDGVEDESITLLTIGMFVSGRVRMKRSRAAIPYVAASRNSRESGACWRFADFFRTPVESGLLRGRAVLHCRRDLVEMSARFGGRRA